MRVAIRVSADAEPWGKMVTYVQEAERLGAAVCFVPEAWHDVGMTTLRLYPAGTTLAERLATLGRALELVEEVNHEQHG